MKKTSFLDCAAPTLRRFLPAEVKQRNLPISLTLPVYQAHIAEQLNISLFEDQLHKLLRLPLDEDEARQQLGYTIQKRLTKLPHLMYSSSNIPENHAPSRFEALFGSQVQTARIKFMPRYEHYWHAIKDNYEQLHREHGIDYYPHDAAATFGFGFALLQNFSTYNDLAQAGSHDPNQNFNEKTRRYYGYFFNLLDMFLTL